MGSAQRYQALGEHRRASPCLPHPLDSEYDIKGLKPDIPILGPFPTRADLRNILLREAPVHSKKVLTLVRLYFVYVHIHFAYLEINLLFVFDGDSIHYLDMAAELDQTGESICGPEWVVARDLTVYETGPDNIERFKFGSNLAEQLQVSSRNVTVTNPNKQRYSPTPRKHIVPVGHSGYHALTRNDAATAHPSRFTVNNGLVASAQ
ncbi:hypothetical protein DEU56DRAFT_907941 [Suillus clintonianus]|uniref:uncharacterized protein n=1 Tax=Suillus clintonianus TaxID=1904413 RepID=UPI001B864B1A|nr:uncharacterized protein DEU56DRAFT_907941 [Suillus clintonianus]KAG2152767.1 hypothetical protein DEU56DRAFT_907941 [Suillus clintonianus]